MNYIFFFRKFRKGRSQKVLFNLALALICTDIIFLAGINQTENDIGCMIVAGMLYYFLLASFLWMMVEAVLQYLKFVKVLDTYVQGFMWKAGIPAWCKWSISYYNNPNSIQNVARMYL